MNKLVLGVVFKGVNKREGGEFTNEKGEVVKYDPCYVLKFDEEKEGEIVERRLRFPLKNNVLYHKLAELEPYTKVNLICDVQLFSGNARVIPVDLG